MGKKIVRSTGLALALASLVLLPLLGHKLLTDWDEGIYSEVSREMLTRGWLTPHWNGQLWLEKPPLMLWITAAFFRLFGVTEFWARAGSALSGVAIVGMLHGWMARRSGLGAAWIGTVVLLSTTGFLHVCRVGEMDVLLSLGCVVALMGLTAVGSEQPAGWMFFWVGFAVAAMTKGAASIVLPLTLVAVTAVERWEWERFARDFWVGMALFAGLVLPWHLAMWHWHGMAFAREYIGLHVLARATGPIEGHDTRWWFYGRVLWVSMMPWVMVVPFAVWRGWRRPDLRVWVVFAFVVVGFFSGVRTRLPHYVAPVYPPVAVMMGVFLAEEVERVRRMALGRQMAVATAVAVIWGGSLALTAGGRKRLHSAAGTGGWTAAEEREAIGFVRQARTIGEGPMLMWWVEPQRSVATAVFYSRRVVEQVEVGSRGDPERYAADARSFDEAVGEGARVILLETKLVTAVPGEFVYSRISAGPLMELGTIRRCSAERKR